MNYETIYNDLKTQLQLVSNGIGEAGKFVLEAHLKRAYAEGISSLVLGIILFILGLVFSLLGIYFYKNAQKKIEAGNLKECDKGDNIFVIVLFSIISCALLGFAIYNIHGGILTYSAPEYKALIIMLDNIQTIKSR